MSDTMEGGNTERSAFAPPPNLLYGMEHGGSPRQNAINYQAKQDLKQNELANQLGGARNKKRRNNRTKCRCKLCLTHSPYLRRRFIKYGGNEGGPPPAGTKMEVPQFQEGGIAVSPMTSSSTSQMVNQTLLTAKIQSVGDTMNGGRRNYRKSKKNRRSRKVKLNTKNIRKTKCKSKPYSISVKRVVKSPFKNISTLKKTLKACKTGKRVGYTQKSSLRSMGLIKRSNGKYCLGDKYKN